MAISTRPQTTSGTARNASSRRRTGVASRAGATLRAEARPRGSASAAARTVPVTAIHSVWPIRAGTRCRSRARQRRRKHACECVHRVPEGEQMRPVLPQRDQADRRQQPQQARPLAQQDGHPVDRRDDQDQDQDDRRAALVVERGQRPHQFAAQAAAAHRADDDRGAHRAFELVGPVGQQVGGLQRQQAEQRGLHAAGAGGPQRLDRPGRGGPQQVAEHFRHRAGVEQRQRQQARAGAKAEQHHAEDRQRQVRDGAKSRQEALQQPRAGCLGADGEARPAG